MNNKNIILSLTTHASIRKMFSTTIIILVALLLSGCVPSRYQYRQDRLPNGYRDFDAAKIPNAVPRVEAKSKWGNAPSYVVRGKRYYVLKSSLGYKKRGIASYYGLKFHNYKTSNGEIYNMYGMTAANKVLPLPTYVKVTNLKNHRWVIVRVNDRGPFHINRIIDLSFAAAKKLDMIKTGTALVEVVAIDPRHPEHTKSTNNSDKSPQVYLQMGAFSEHNNALRLEHNLRRYTQRKIRITIGKSNGRSIYRVQIGPVKNVEEADQLTIIFKQHGMGNAFAVVR